MLSLCHLLVPSPSVPSQETKKLLFTIQYLEKNRCLFGTIIAIILIPIAYYIYMALEDQG